MRELNPEHVRAVLGMINRAPYFRHLSMEVKEIGKGHSLVEITLGREHLNPFGGLHGGVHASVLDTAAYWALYGEIDENAGFTSVDLRIDYLAPAGGGTLIARGKRLKIGRTMCLAEATMHDAKGKYLAHALSKSLVAPGLQTIRNVVEFTGGGNLPPKFL